MKYAKLYASLVAAAGVVASSGLLHGTVELVFNTVIAASGAAAVGWLPNTPAAQSRTPNDYNRPGV